MARLTFIFLIVFFCIIQTIEFTCCVRNSSLSCFEKERNALVKFKYSLSDPFNTNRLSSWVSEDCCSWDGVGCDSRTGHVVKIDIRNRNRNSLIEFELYNQSRLVGEELNPSLIELKQLTYLDLSGNNFSGSRIPKFLGSFRYLRYLNLSYAVFNGKIPHELGNLSALHSLDLSVSQSLDLTVFHNSNLWVDSLHWMSHFYSLQYLSMSSVNLSRLSSDWSYIINGLPSLSALDLSSCGLDKLSLDLSRFNLTSLTVLHLRANSLGGQIPNFIRNMTSLEVLDLSSNNLVSPIPSWFGNLHNLVSLDLKYNQFTGQLGRNTFENSSSQSIGAFDWLGQLKNLKYLDLYENNFSGSIPNSLGTLSALRELDLGYNKLNGTIPKNIGLLSELRTLYLHSNSLKGFVSEDHFSKLSRLEELELKGNSLVFNVGSHWVPPFQLKRLSMRSCKLGPKFPSWLQTQSKLSSLDISNTSISSSIPDWFWKQTFNSLRYLDVSRNQIHGQLPILLSSNIVAITFLLLGFNKFEGPLPHFPSTVVILSLCNNSISGPIPKNIGYMMPLMEQLDLSSNFISGSIPSSICTMKTLRQLDLSKNQLSGDLPQCWTSLHSLQEMNLASNNLSGTIASFTGQLHILQALKLWKNNFQGEIPLALKNSTMLYLLDLGENKLSGNIPTWIGENLSVLQVLRLRSNMFGGNIPPQLCQLTSLRIMDLAQNNLSGIIPPCLGNITAMRFAHTIDPTSNLLYKNPDLVIQTLKGRELEYDKILSIVVNLDVSSNQLTGLIPRELTLLSGLIGLNLSSNHLTGGIPEKIDNMSLLQSLDLSKNKLSGRIPQSMSALTFLSYLNVSYNNLSGQIPSGNQLQTLNDASIYKGNANLCGDPLEKRCEGEDSSQAPKHADDVNERDDPNPPGFYIGMALGFIIGFWGVGCVLFFKRHWRYAYFGFINNAIDTLFVEIVTWQDWLKKKFKCNQVEA